MSLVPETIVLVREPSCEVLIQITIGAHRDNEGVMDGVQLNRRTVIVGGFDVRGFDRYHSVFPNAAENLTLAEGPSSRPRVQNERHAMCYSERRVPGRVSFETIRPRTARTREAAGIAGSLAW